MICTQMKQLLYISNELCSDYWYKYIIPSIFTDQQLPSIYNVIMQYWHFFVIII